MTIRFKTSWIIFAVTFGIIGMIVFIMQVIEFGLFKNRNFMMLIASPVFILIIFVFPTARIHFSESYLKSECKIGFSSLVLSHKQYEIQWRHVYSVSSLFWYWFPFQFIGVSGDGKMIYLGSFFTRRNESLLYMAEHVKPEKMDKDTRKIIEKIRSRQAAQKTKT